MESTNKKEIFIPRNCPHCGNPLVRIFNENKLWEEWTWNEYNWELTDRASLQYNPKEKVGCCECNNIVGTGIDFGF